MAREKAMPESEETPEMEAKAHSAKFLRRAVSKKEGKRGKRKSSRRR